MKSTQANPLDFRPAGTQAGGQRAKDRLTSRNRRHEITITAAIKPHIAIRNELLARTPAARQPHVMGVEGMSIVLANKWGIDQDRCHLAALLHDLAKPFPFDEQRLRLDNCTVIEATDEDREHPAVWHGLLAAQEAAERFQVDDREVLEAVAYHSTGCHGLSDIGMVIYVSDFIEPSRNWPGVEDSRARIADMTLHEAAHEVAKNKLEKLHRKGRAVHSRTHDMANWLQTLLTPKG